jgi:formylglycine-generating enzyme required for sulfatase activity
MNHSLRVFLCHSSYDKAAVHELYEKLCAEKWIDPWLDEKKLLPGQDWDMVIEKAVEDSHAVIACLSNNSLTKEGYIQKELRFILDIALTKPEEEIFVIPLRLEECQPPRRLRAFHYVDYFPRQKQDIAYRFILQSLKRRAESLGIEVVDERAWADVLAKRQAEEHARRELEERIQQEAREKVRREMEDRLRTETEERVRKEFELQPTKNREEKKNVVVETPKLPHVVSSSNKLTLSNGMELMCVPAGIFLMGSRDGNKLAYDEEKPRQSFDIPYDYWMARYPVTNELYNTYISFEGGKHREVGWEKKKNHPVLYIEWIEAMEYCQWLNNLLKGELPSGLMLRLPTETEWEKAARSTDGREYPWGAQFDKNKCNTSEGGKGGTTSVGSYSPHGDSPYGCADMSGNVWEWTHSVFKSYPYMANDGRENEKSSDARVLRGGSFTNSGRDARCAFRYNRFYNFSGFRVVAAPPISK